MDDMKGLLSDLGMTLAVTAFEHNRVFIMPPEKKEWWWQVRTPMGLSYHESGLLAVGGFRTLATYRAFHDLQGAQEAGVDVVFLPMAVKNTGLVDIHQVGWLDTLEFPQPVFVNTAFSSVCYLNWVDSFVDLWRPEWLTELVAEDRCHMSGFVLQNGAVKLVTCHGETDSPRGWKDTLHDGVLVDITKGVIARGFHQPHSPVIHDGHIYLCDSNLSYLTRLDLDGGNRQNIEIVPGYARGLAIHGDIAFVGFSDFRDSGANLAPGVSAINIKTGETVAQIILQSPTKEVFDIELLPYKNPRIMDWNDEPSIHGITIP